MKRNPIVGVAAIALVAGLSGLALTDDENMDLKVTREAPPSIGINPTSAVRWVGNSATLSWSCSNCAQGATSSDLGGEGQTSGSRSVNSGHATTNTYSVTVKNAAGDAASASASVTWQDPPPPPPPPRSSMDCFATGTLITMADGSKRRVEELKAGDEVRSYDAANGKFVTVKVTEATTRQGGDYVIINGGKGVTLEHKFYANGRWVNAGNLKVGDKLIGPNGEEIEIRSIEPKPGPVTVHPIRVENPPGTFIAEGVVVHNRDHSSSRNEGLVRGVRVTMADGSRKPIEQVKAGDKILTINPKSGILYPYLVTQAATETVDRYIEINGVIKMGTSHKVFTPKKKK